MHQFKILYLTAGLFIFCQVARSVSDEERKASWNSPAPRGAKSSSSKSSGSSSRLSSASSSGSNSSQQFSYADLSKNFDQEIKRSAEEFTKLLPKVDEKNFLKEMEEAAKLVKGSRNQETPKGISIESSLFSQYSAAVISTIQQTTQIQLDLIARQKQAVLNQEKQNKLARDQQEKEERMRGLSPMAITLGAAEITKPGFPQGVSPLSIRNQVRHGANSITSRAYKSPE